jgi:hypothetical protein
MRLRPHPFRALRADGRLAPAHGAAAAAACRKGFAARGVPHGHLRYARAAQQSACSAAQERRADSRRRSEGLQDLGRHRALAQWVVLGDLSFCAFCTTMAQGAVGPTPHKTPYEREVG